MLIVAAADFPGYIYRLLPVYGRLYISNNYFCFKSSGPLASKTRVRPGDCSARHGADANVRRWSSRSGTC
jgi:hypothetical protein